jgi:hypothetical protein
MAVRVNAWKAKDGRTFPTEAEADRHDADRAIDTWVDLAGIGRGGEWSGEMVAGVIRKQAKGLHAILSAYLGCNTDYPKEG